MRNSVSIFSLHYQGWLFTIGENAFLKIKKYETGTYNYRVYFNRNIIIPPCNYPTRIDDLWMAPLKALYSRTLPLSGTYYWYNNPYSGELQYGGWNTCQPYSDPTFNKRLSYVILGRMCHLLEDMSVPEHAHCDDHACRSGMRCSALEENEDGWWSASPWIADRIWNNGNNPFINPFFKNGSDDDPLYNLMYLLNQIADHYASCSVGGDDNFDGIFPYLSTILPTLAKTPINSSDINTQNTKDMYDVLIPYAIRATAGLLYWFAFETAQVPLVEPKTDVVNKWPPTLIKHKILRYSMQ